jgi:BASS family bile acid:Na+ symporter
MTIEKVTNILVTVTLIEMMVATGLGVTVRDLVAVVRDWSLVGRAMIANYVLVPAATVGLLLLFKPHPMVATGFLILAVCPGAPFGPPFVSVAKGNVAVAVGLMVVLAGSSALLAPLLLALHLPLFAGDEPLSVETTQIAMTLLVTQIIPLAAGIALRRARPGLAALLQKPANLLSKLLNLTVVVLVLATQGHLMTEIRVSGFVGMFILLAASWAAGWVLGGRATGERRAMTLTTSLRNVGVGMIIAAGAFAGTPALTAVLVYGLLGVFGSLLLALRWGRTAAPDSAASPQMVMSQ